MGYHFWDDKEEKIGYHKDLVDRAGEGIYKGGGALLDGLIGGFDAILSPILNAGIGLVVGAMFLILIVGIIVIGVLELGFIRSTVNISLSVPESVVMEDATLKAVAAEDLKVKEADFDKTGSVELKLKRGNYGLYVCYDGLASGVDLINLGSLAEMTDTVEPLMMRAVIVQIRDGDQNLIMTDDITVTDEAGQRVDCAQLTGDRYVLHLPEDASGKVLSFRVQGYQPLEIAEDWNDNRLGKLEVTLVAQE